MRSAGNFNPEWGYLAPAPSFMRTARAVLVATAIGATAGAAVVISLIDRPAGDAGRATSVTAHAIVTSVQAATALATPPATAAVAVAAPIAAATSLPPAAQPQSPRIAPQIAPQIATQPPPAAATHAAAIAPPQPPALDTPATENARASDAIAAPAPKPAPGIAALSEAAPIGEAAPADTPDQALIPPQTVPPEKKTKRHLAGEYASDPRYKPGPSLGTVLRRIFSPHTGRSYYPSH